MGDTLTAPLGARATEPELHRGLVGVTVDRTAVSHVDPVSGSLLYRGHPVEQLVEHHDVEDVAHLLLVGELPTPEEREAVHGCLARLGLLASVAA